MGERYIPALGYTWLTGLYDPVLRATMREATFKSRLVAQAELRPGHRVLDIGCGTATLTIEIKRSQPEADVVGLDGDPEVLRRAAAKVATAGLTIALDHGFSDRLPYPDASFDRVLTSLLLHHLTAETKRRTLAEIHRVLRPGGQVHIADWGKAQDAVMRGAFFLIQLLDGFATTTDNVNGKIPQYLRDAGLADVRETSHLRTVFGTLSLYRGERPR
jgi:ubiquinone/menaquinone biosynthesis C-methylase UbiE